MAKEVASLLIELRATTAKLSADFGKSTGMLQKWEKGISKSMGNVQKTIQAALFVGGVVAVKKLADALGEAAEKGEKAASIKEGFERLGGSTAEIVKAKTAVLGMVDSFDLMQIASSGLVKQIPGFNDNFGKMAELGGRLANTLGKDTKEAIQQVADAIASGKTTQLQAVGITVNASDAYKKYAESIGTTADKLTNQQKRVAVAIEAEGQLSTAIERQAEVTGSVANAHATFNASLDEAIKKVGIAINSNEGLARAWSALAESVEKVDWTKVGDNIAYISSAIIEKFVPALKGGIEFLNDFTHSLQVASVLPAFNFNLGEASEFIRNSEALEKQAAAAKKAGEAIQELRKITVFKGDEFVLTRADLDKASEAVKRLEEAMKTGGPATDKYRDELAKLKQDLKNFKTLLGPDPGSSNPNGDLGKAKELAKNLKDKLINEAVKPINDEWLREQKQAHQESVDFWTSAFENAITGATFNLKDALTQVAVGFAAEIAASLTGISFQGGIKGVGQSIAQSVLGTAGNGGIGGLAGGALAGGALLGAGGLLEGTYAGGMYAGITGTAIAPSSAAMGSGLGAGSAIASAAPYVAAAFAAYKLADHFGLFGGGPKNPDTVARKKVEGFLEEKTGQNWIFGPNSRFNNGKGWDYFNKLDDASKKAFGGIGEGLVNLLGITENIGPQIGAILSENLGGNASKIKGLLDQLGVTLQDIEAQMIIAGKKGKSTWLEIEAAIEGMEAAVTAAQSSMSAAMEELVNSGGRGQQALDGVRDSAIAAEKNGAKTLEDMKKLMLEAGGDPTLVNDMFQAFQQRGITSLDQIKNASDRTLGAIVADVTALGFVFKDVTDQIDSATQALQGLQAATGASTSAAGAVGIDVPQFATGGIVTRPTLGMIGEAGPETVMPLSRVNGKLGVRAVPTGRAGGGLVIHVDARGADAGVEHRVTAAMRSLEDRVIARAVNEVHDQMRRGRWSH